MSTALPDAERFRRDGLIAALHLSPTATAELRSRHQGVPAPDPALAMRDVLLRELAALERHLDLDRPFVSQRTDLEYCARRRAVAEALAARNALARLSAGGQAAVRACLSAPAHAVWQLGCELAAVALAGVVDRDLAEPWFSTAAWRTIAEIDARPGAAPRKLVVFTRRLLPAIAAIGTGDLAARLGRHALGAVLQAGAAQQPAWPAVVVAFPALRGWPSIGDGTPPVEDEVALWLQARLLAAEPGSQR